MARGAEDEGWGEMKAWGAEDERWGEMKAWGFRRREENKK